MGDVVKDETTAIGDEFEWLAGPTGPFYLGMVNIGRYGTQAARDLDAAFKIAATGANAHLSTIEDQAEETTDIMTSTFADMLGKGFMGELETFADLWDELWQDLAKSMTGELGNAFDEWIKSDKEGGLGGLMKSFEKVIGDNQLAAGLGGVGMAMQGYQQGGAAGIFMGMAGGALTGAALGSIIPGLGTAIGAVIGAIIGGVAAYFGGGENPYSYGSISLTGGAVTGSDGQTLGEGAWDLFAKERVEEYRAAVMQMNDVLRLFGDGGLFELIGDAPVFDFGGQGDLDHFATVFREQWLPEAMRQMFEGAINQGLGNLGVTDETIDQLWQELGGLTGANWIPALETFISSIVGITDLYADMDWNAILDESKQDSFTAFMAGLNEIADQVQMQMLGLDDMTLLERAEQAQTIEALIVQARQAEIQMLRQIDQLQKNINRSVDQQIEGIRTGGMNSAEQRSYYMDQIAQTMAGLRGAGSPEEVQQLMADLQRYVGLVQGTLGDNLYQSMSPFGGETWADYLIGLLEEGRGLSNDAFEEMRDQIRETNEALIAELELLIAALTDFTGVLTGGGGGDSFVKSDITIPVDVNVVINGDKSLFVRDVRAIIHAELSHINRTTAAAPHGVN
jgi:hypothetical protein